MKKFLFLCSMVVMIFGMSSSSFALTKIYETSVKQVINSGTNLTKYKRFTDKGWLEINVVDIDLKDKNTTVSTLTSANGLQTFQNVKTMLTNEKNCIAAINADFFNGTSKKGNIIGMTVKDGKMLTSTYFENEIKDTMASFYIDDEDGSAFDYFSNDITLSNLSNDAELKIGEINKWSSNYEYPVLYTSDWGEKSLGQSLDIFMTELVVENDKVREIRNGGDAVSIPEDGYVICAIGEAAENINNNFRVGNRVSLDIDIGLDIERVKMAVSGGAMLVKEGKVCSFSHMIYGTNPRTAIGISRDGHTVYLITIDGRQASSVGVTQQELAEIIAEKGIYTAMNLDGGGSTSMVVRELGDAEPTLENSPSDGSLRMVPNAVGVFNTAETGKLDGLLIEADDVNVFVGCKKELAVKGYDEYYNPIDVDISDVKWSFSGVDASVKNGIFVAGDEAGTVTVTASVGKAVGSIDIDVLSAPNELSISPRRISVDVGESVSFKVNGQNKNGYFADLKNDEVEWKVTDNGSKIIDGVFTAHVDGSYVVSASCGKATSYAIVNVGNVEDETKILPQDIKGDDESNVSSELNSSGAFRVVVSPELYSGMMIEQLKNKKMEGIINNNSEIVIYPYANGSEMLIGVSKTKVVGGSYAVSNRGNLSIITLNVANGGLRLSGSSQWISLQNDIRNAKKNVLLVMNGNLDSFTDIEERQLFIDVLCELKRNTGKNIWVIQKGGSTEYSMKRGVKYLSIASSAFSDVSSEDIADKKYIMITVNDDKMTYEIKRVF